MNMPDATTGVTLLGRDRARGGARGALMAGLTAVVAEPLLRRAVLGNVTDWGRGI